MFKRSVLALLFMLVAVLSFAHADNVAPNILEEVPAGVTLVGGQEPIPSAIKEQFIGGGRRFFPGYRYRFMFPYGGGFRYGWRYPIGYWNTFGRGIYGPSCLFGRPFGRFFYC
ncbi:hypothetical protein PRIC2_013142 [Phytophthora ramorum]